MCAAAALGKKIHSGAFEGIILQDNYGGAWVVTFGTGSRVVVVMVSPGLPTKLGGPELVVAGVEATF